MLLRVGQPIYFVLSIKTRPCISFQLNDGQTVGNVPLPVDSFLVELVVARIDGLVGALSWNSNVWNKLWFVYNKCPTRHTTVRGRSLGDPNPNPTCLTLFTGGCCRPTSGWFVCSNMFPISLTWIFFHLFLSILFYPNLNNSFLNGNSLCCFIKIGQTIQPRPYFCQHGM